MNLGLAARQANSRGPFLKFHREVRDIATMLLQIGREFCALDEGEPRTFDLKVRNDVPVWLDRTLAR